MIPDSLSSIVNSDNKSETALNWYWYISISSSPSIIGALVSLIVRVIVSEILFPDSSVNVTGISSLVNNFGLYVLKESSK